MSYFVLYRPSQHELLEVHSVQATLIYKKQNICLWMCWCPVLEFKWCHRSLEIISTIYNEL